MTDTHDCVTHLTRHPSGKRHLPQPRGPHSVGFFDLMTPGDPTEGSLVRIYYPTLEQCLEEHGRWPVWAEDKYISGLLTFMQAMLYRWPSWAPKGEYLHVEKMKLISPLIPKFGFPALFKAVNGTVYVPIIQNARPIPGSKWPVIVFSHGMGCARFTYSQICYDLASHGFIVAAVEHRDGSGCLSFYNDNGHRSWIQHRRVEHGDDEYTIRNKQVHLRTGEVSHVLDVLVRLNGGEVVENVMAADLGKKADVDLNLFRDKFELERPILCGHSFGGATTLLGLSKDPRFKVGIVLDGWLFPIRDEVIAEDVQQPVMFINTESFINKDNVDKMVTFSTADQERTCFYIKGSVHQNHIDAPFVLQKSVVKKILGMHSSTCPETVMSLTNKLMVQFIRRRLDLADDDEINCDVDKLRHLLKSGFEFEAV